MKIGESHERVLIFALMFAALAVCVCFLTQNAGARTITVDDVGGGNFTKIQDAINASENGDTIRVWEGTYYENVVVNKTVSLIGNGTTKTIIDGGKNGDVVEITANWMNMSGFMITGGGRGNIWELGTWGAGIVISSNHNMIIDNNISNNKRGIIFIESENTTISNNSWFNNEEHSFLYSSHNNTISHNTIFNNTSSNNWFGFYLLRSINNKLLYNSFSNMLVGISLYHSPHTLVSHNLFTNTWCAGILIWGDLSDAWTTHEIDTSNLVNGRPIYYYKNRSGLVVPPGAGQVILANCTEIIVEDQYSALGCIGIMVGYSSRITISNITLSSTSNYGITLLESAYCTITDSCLENSRLRLQHSSNNTISNNRCCHSVGSGIYLSNSHNNTLRDNVCNSNFNQGISLHKSDMNTISDNLCFDNNEDGICFIESSYNLLSNTSCISNNESGIYFSESCGNTIIHNNCSSNTLGGVSFVRSCDFNIIENNTCVGNNYGMNIEESDHTVITENTCVNNTVGMCLKYSYQCTISNNTLSDNKAEGIHLLSSNITLSNNTITANSVGIRFDHYRYLNAHYNTISGNGEGINATNNSGEVIDVTLNWWGHPSGPYHPEINPDGKGDNVTDFVEFSPWLDEKGDLEYLSEKEDSGFIMINILLGIMIIAIISLSTLVILRETDSK